MCKEITLRLFKLFFYLICDILEDMIDRRDIAYVHFMVVKDEQALAALDHDDGNNTTNADLARIHAQDLQSRYPQSVVTDRWVNRGRVYDTPWGPRVHGLSSIRTRKGIPGDGFLHP